MPFPLGTPKTRVRQGVLGDVGDHSWEGCGTSPESLSTSSQPGFDNLSAPTSGTHESLESLGFPLGQPPADLDSGLDQAAQRYPPPGAFNKGWYFPGRPLRCGAAGGALASPASSPAWPRAQAARPHPHAFLSLPRSRCPVTGRWWVPFPSSPCPSGPPLTPHQCASAPCCVTAASPGGGAGCDWESSFENQTGFVHYVRREPLSLRP